jgi:hypothetical protein
MATGSLNAEGVWIYGEDDSEPTFSALLNKLGNSVSDALVSAGKVIQVVQGNHSSPTINTTNTQIDTGLTATITPKFASSKILVIVQQGGCYKSPGNANNWLLLYLYRNAILRSSTFGAYSASALALNVGTMGFSFLDDPATTSPVTYKTRFANDVNASSVAVNFGGGTSFITLLEVAA